MKTGRVDAATHALRTPQLLTLALLAAISPLATAMYLPALPEMAAELGTDAQTVQLTITTFLVGLAVGQLVIGPVSDRMGRRPLLLACTALCVLASAACALAPGIPFLVAARLLQGLAGAGGIVLGRAIIADLAQGRAAARAFSLLMTIGAIAPVVAPLLGGAVGAIAGWRGVFVVLTLFALAMFAGAVWLLPESLPPALRLTESWAATARRAARVLSRRRFVGYTAVVVFAYATLIAYVSASPFVLQIQFGLTPVGYSLAFAANAAGLTIGSFANARMLRRTSPQRLLSIGLTAEAVVAFLVLAGAVSATLTVPVLLALLWVAVTGLGFVMGNATSLALDEAPRERGSASALLGAGQFGLAALVAPVASIGGGAVAMGATMAACAVVAAIAFALAARAPRAGGVDPAGADPVE